MNGNGLKDINVMVDGFPVPLDNFIDKQEDIPEIKNILKTEMVDMVKCLPKRPFPQSILYGKKLVYTTKIFSEDEVIKEIAKMNSHRKDLFKLLLRSPGTWVGIDTLMKLSNLENRTSVSSMVARMSMYLETRDLMDKEKDPTNPKKLRYKLNRRIAETEEEFDTLYTLYLAWEANERKKKMAEKINNSASEKTKPEFKIEDIPPIHENENENVKGLLDEFTGKLIGKMIKGIDVNVNINVRFGWIKND